MSQRDGWPPDAEDEGWPQDRAAEEVVLSAMMSSAGAAGEACAVLAAADFFIPAHRVIFEAVVALLDEGVAGVVAVADRLAAARQLGKAGGRAYLDVLLGSVPAEVNVAHHARIVRDRSVERQMITAGGGIVKAGRAHGVGLAEKVDDAYRVLDEAAGLAVPAGARPVAELLPAVLDRIEAGPGDRGVLSGWEELDELTGGFRGGQLIVVAGRPVTGKSTVLHALVSAAAIGQGMPVLLSTAEMSRQEVLERILAARSGVLLTRMRDGALRDPEDWDRLAPATAELAGAPLHVNDGGLLRVQDIRSDLRAMRREGTRPGLVVVDYLQLMTGAGRTENRQVEVGGISRGLKLLAKDHDVPVIAGAQLNRGPEMRSDHQPLLADLRESGCMPASTRLLLADGTEVTLGELVLSQEQPDVFAVDRRHKLVASRLTRAFPSGIKPVFRVRLASGRTVDATANHEFLAVTGWQRLDTLAAGSFIAVPRILPEPPRTRQMDEDELVLMAHLIGDGTIGPAVKYATADPANRAAVEDAARRRFGIEASATLNSRTWQVWLPAPYRLTHDRHHPVRNWLEPLGLWGSRAGTKFLPPDIFSLPDDQMALFLRHLWATDGSITVSRNGRGRIVSVYYATISRRLADDVQRALLRFGIRTVIRRSRKAGYADCWNVVIQGSGNQSRFLSGIGCHGARGTVIPEVLEILGGMKPNPNRDLVPHAVVGLVRDAMTRAGVTHRVLAAGLGEGYSGSYLLGNTSRPRRFSRARLARMAEITRSRELADIARSDLYWDEIAEVTPLGAMPTFDATVERTHNFIANGIVAHNSVEQDADVVVLLSRPDMYGEVSRAGEIDLIVAKNRHGRTGTVTLGFQGHYGRVRPLEWVPSGPAGRGDPAVVREQAGQDRRDELAAKRAAHGPGGAG